MAFADTARSPAKPALEVIVDRSVDEPSVAIVNRPDQLVPPVSVSAKALTSDAATSSSWP